jgi:hypothetical protein
VELSEFDAEFSGMVWNVRWLKRNYVTMLCAFDPVKVHDYTAAYTSCMDRAPQWVALVLAGRAKDLLKDPYDYAGNCVAPYLH